MIAITEQDDRIYIVNQQQQHITNSLSNHAILQALGHCITAINLLRNPYLTLKQYYELYTLITTNCLNQITEYCLISNLDLHDLYDTVQYTGNVLPRIYLLIAVGHAYIKADDSYRVEVIKDLLEMTHGVQNPYHGIFLRYYLTKIVNPLLQSESFKDVELQFKTDTMLFNFIEMNKFWIRLQFEGTLKDRIRFLEYREQLKPLIGEQILDLSKITTNSKDHYKEHVLPVLLRQITKCNDVMAQTYIFETILQLFPLSYHLDSLPDLLDVTLQMHHDVSINEMMRLVIQAIKSGTTHHLSLIEYTNLFFEYFKSLQQRAPALSLVEFIPLLESIMDLSLDEQNANNINGYLELLHIKMESKHTIVSQEEDLLLQQFMTFQNLKHLKNPISFNFKVLFTSKWYRMLISMQPIDLQQNILVTVLLNFYNHCKELELGSKENLNVLLEVCNPLLDQSENSHTQFDEVLSNLTNFVISTMKLKPISAYIEVLIILKNWYYSLDPNYIIKSHPTIIANFWKLQEKYQTCKKSEDEPDFISKQIFKHISNSITELLTFKELETKLLAYNLLLQTATFASKFNMNDITLDFISQSFELFEEQFYDKNENYTCIVRMIQTLFVCQGKLDKSAYESLIVRCTIAASKLQKKSDQCRAISKCSHLWWVQTTDKNSEPQFKNGKRVLECIQKSLKVADSIMDNVQSSQLLLEILETCIYYSKQQNSWETQITNQFIGQLVKLIQNNMESLNFESKILEKNQEQKQNYVSGEYDQLVPIKNVTTNKLPPPITKTDVFKIPISHFARLQDRLNH